MQNKDTNEFSIDNPLQEITDERCFKILLRSKNKFLKNKTRKVVSTHGILILFKQLMLTKENVLF